jgi:L-rhamnose mutarotase
MPDSHAREAISFSSLILCLVFAGCAANAQVKRYGSVIGVKKEAIPQYKRIHADVWPDVLKMLEERNIRNYSIYLHEVEDGRYYLFSYFEYTGDDFEADMAKIAANQTVKEWWKITDPMQIPLENRAEGEWWATMEEVFHVD